jgi:peptide/nickel transport system ATP-binding protein
MGKTEVLFAKPAHPYTRELVDATPRLERPTRVAPLAPADGGDATAHGCPYVGRCPYARARCREESPTLDPIEEGGRRVACWYPLS